MGEGKAREPPPTPPSPQIHTYIHTHIHTYIHTYIYTHIHTYSAYINILIYIVHILKYSWVLKFWHPKK